GQRERRVGKQVHVLNPAVDVCDARRAQQFRKHQAAAANPAAPRLNTAPGAVQQADRYSEFVGPDPRPAEIPVNRRHIAYAIALLYPRGEGGRAAQLLVAVAEQMTSVTLVEPANGTHQAASTAPAFLPAWYRSVEGAIPKSRSKW